VIGQPQLNLGIIQVENWGIGIPEDKLGAIFLKFIRVEREDRIRPIRGMGLGLYIARLYANVHGGHLYCRYSRPTLDDPIRTKRLEGFETSIELRIPGDIQKAIRRVRIDGGDQ
jgi:signal transduction histidine kinase